MSRQTAILLGVGILAAVALALTIIGAVREAVVVPLLYLWFVAGVLLSSVPQYVLWGGFVLVALVAALRSMAPPQRPRYASPPPATPASTTLYSWAGLLERAEINTVVISRGAHSGLLSASQPPNDAERAAHRNVVFHYYDEFKRRVTEGRSVGGDALESIAGGRVWLGSEAAERGLVDSLGGLPEAIVRAQELAQLAPDPTAPLLLMRGGRVPLP
ncbi:hypothetical protein SE17_38065, partial [Kouleothrix aurantiaca]